MIQCLPMVKKWQSELYYGNLLPLLVQKLELQMNLYLIVIPYSYTCSYTCSYYMYMYALGCMNTCFCSLSLLTISLCILSEDTIISFLAINIHAHVLTVLDFYQRCLTRNRVGMETCNKRRGKNVSVCVCVHVHLCVVLNFYIKLLLFIVLYSYSCSMIFTTCYMSSSNSSQETRERAQRLADQIGR